MRRPSTKARHDGCCSFNLSATKIQLPKGRVLSMREPTDKLNTKKKNDRSHWELTSATPYPGIMLMLHSTGAGCNGDWAPHYCCSIVVCREESLSRGNP